MKLEKLLKNYLNSREKRPRKIGRYHSSELYSIITGKLKPEDFFKPKTFDLQVCRNIYEGEIREKALSILLRFNKILMKEQVKDVLKIKDFEIVCVADFTFEDRILECKAPGIMPDSIKPWNYPQLEIQHRLFNLPVYIIYIKERFDYRVFKYTPNNEFYQEILKRVEEFHIKLKKLNAKA